MKFEKIIGNEIIIESLQKMVSSNEINHAILFDGINGIGKKNTALVFSKSIFCESNENKPCGVCSKCLQFDSKSNPDFMFLNADGNIIKKLQIIEVIDFLAIRPYDSKYKIVLIEDFDKATVESQNAFLKTLEDGPEYGIIILLSENKKNILDTVLSRVKLYKFSPIPNHRIVEYLMENYSVSESESFFYSKYSNGSIGKAIKMATDEDLKENRKEYIDIFDKALKNDKEYVLSHLKVFKDVKNFKDILDLYLTWLRDLYILKKTNSIDFVVNVDLIGKLKSEVHLDYSQISFIKDRIIKFQSDLKYNITAELAVELFFIDILEECE